MLPIHDPRITHTDGKWLATCTCGKRLSFAGKSACLRMLNRGTCRHCKKDYRSVPSDVAVYKRADGKWCSTCSGCGNEQAYTRKDHAKQSELGDWQCKSCVARLKGFSENQPVGDVMRLFNKYSKSAAKRNIAWNLTPDELQTVFTGKCALTGWEISMAHGNQTASLDRIDSTKPYTLENIQWVHTMVNMSKNKYPQDRFVQMCKAVADRAKW